jgi:chorismate mutase
MKMRIPDIRLQLRRYFSLNEDERQTFEVTDTMMREIEMVEHYKDLVSRNLPTFRCIELMMERFEVSRNVAKVVAENFKLFYDEREIQLERLLEQVKKDRMDARLAGNHSALVAATKLELELVRELYGDTNDQLVKERINALPKRLAFAPETLPGYKKISKQEVDDLRRQLGLISDDNTKDIDHEEL